MALLFSLAVFIHELGHFLAARWLGLQVDAFSIGFGPAIWKKRIDGIEYKICWILFGGYVALPQLDPSGMEKVQGDQEKEEKSNERILPDVAPWKRIVVSVAGPAGNFFLAVLLAAVIALWPGEFMTAASSYVAGVEESSEAYKAGLRAGDRIRAVNGRSVDSWYDLQVEFQLAGEMADADLEVVRDDSVMSMNLALSTNNVMGVRMLEGVYPDAQSIVGKVVDGSPAAAAGLQVGDVLLEMNGITVLGASQFIEILSENGGRPVDITVLRDNEKTEISLEPRYDKKLERHLIGIVFALDRQVAVKPWMMHKGFYEQLKWDCMAVGRVLNALVAPKNKGERKAVARNIGGPVMIITMFYDSVRSDFLETLGLLRMICINLAILNLLPLPVLDGGHVCFALYEVITRRKPHPKVVAGLVNVFAVILIILMIFLMFRDVKNRFKLSQLKKQMQEETATP
ncbi:MAG: RIP metalloprotease RseP [Kiritimatiellia bacterium]